MNPPPLSRKAKKGSGIDKYILDRFPNTVSVMITQWVLPLDSVDMV